MESGLGKVVGEAMYGNGQASYNFTLLAAEAHESLAYSALFEGRYKRARIYFGFAIREFIDAREYQHAHDIAKANGLFSELKYLFRRRMRHFRGTGSLADIAIMEGLLQKKQPKKDDLETVQV